MTEESYYRYLLETEPVVLPVARWRKALAKFDHRDVLMMAVFLWGLAIGFAVMARVCADPTARPSARKRTTTLSQEPATTAARSGACASGRSLTNDRVQDLRPPSPIARVEPVP